MSIAEVEQFVEDACIISKNSASFRWFGCGVAIFQITAFFVFCLYGRITRLCSVSAAEYTGAAGPRWVYVAEVTQVSVSGCSSCWECLRQVCVIRDAVHI